MTSAAQFTKERHKMHIINYKNYNDNIIKAYHDVGHTTHTYYA